MKKIPLLVLFFLTFFLSNAQSVRDFVEEKYFSNQETGRSIKFGYISSLNTYGLTFKDSEGNLAYFMNCTIDISSDNQYMELTSCMSPVTGGTLGKIVVYKDRMIWYGSDGSLLFNLDNNKESDNIIQSNDFDTEQSKSIIGKKIIIGNLQIAENEFGYPLTYEQAIAECAKLGKGWRLPSKEELNIIYENKIKTGGLIMDQPYVKLYWTSTKEVGSNKVFTGCLTNSSFKFELATLGKDKYGEELYCRLRAVKSLKL